MAEQVVVELNNFSTFKYDQDTKRIINMKFQDDTNIDEFLAIQNILDNFKVDYRFDRNFDIQINN